MLSVYPRPSVGSNTAVGFEVSRSSFRAPLGCSCFRFCGGIVSGLEMWEGEGAGKYFT